jgi:hypothetical protein
LECKVIIILILIDLLRPEERPSFDQLHSKLQDIEEDTNEVQQPEAKEDTYGLSPE